MCVTLLGRPYEKYVKGDVSIGDSLRKNVNQIGLGSYRPHGTRAELRNSGLFVCRSTHVISLCRIKHGDKVNYLFFYLTMLSNCRLSCGSEVWKQEAVVEQSNPVSLFICAWRY